MRKSLYYPMRDNVHMQVANICLKGKDLRVKIVYENGLKHTFRKRV